jgi:hypothetical protein
MAKLSTKPCELDPMFPTATILSPLCRTRALAKEMGPGLRVVITVPLDPNVVSKCPAVVQRNCPHLWHHRFRSIA